jgi:hypothetical protein
MAPRALSRAGVVFEQIDPAHMAGSTSVAQGMPAELCRIETRLSWRSASPAARRRARAGL